MEIPQAGASLAASVGPRQRSFRIPPAPSSGPAAVRRSARGVGVRAGRASGMAVLTMWPVPARPVFGVMLCPRVGWMVTCLLGWAGPELNWPNRPVIKNTPERILIDQTQGGRSMPTVGTSLHAYLNFIQIGLGYVSGVLSGALAPLIAECAKRRFLGPRLEVMYKEEERYMPITEVPGRLPGRLYPAKYLRVRVENTGRRVAKGCKAYLVKLEEIVNSEPQPTFYQDTFRLRWAYEQQDELHEGIDIPPGIFIFFDVLSCKHQEDKDMTIIQVSKFSIKKFRNKIKFNKSYRFTILVASEETEPEQISLTVKMGETWRDFRVIDSRPPSVKGHKPTRELS